MKTRRHSSRSSKGSSSPSPSSPSKKSPSSLSSSSPKAKKPSSPSTPTLTVSLVSIEVRHNGWPGEGVKATDMSLVLQLEDPAAAAGNAALASTHLPFAASSGQTVSARDLPPDLNGVPFFGGPVRLPSHVNLHARLFVERTNAVGPILGAALNTVIGQFVGRIPLLAAPAREVLHIQIGKVIATELARATAIVPVETSFRGTHPVTLALVAPRTIPGLYAPPGSPEGYKKGVVATEGDLVALLHLTLTMTVPG
ncbi:MAG: hypothetical protein ABI584_14930 [Acidobacteriota bacterium]